MGAMSTTHEARVRHTRGTHAKPRAVCACRPNVLDTLPTHACCVATSNVPCHWQRTCYTVVERRCAGFCRLLRDERCALKITRMLRIVPIETADAILPAPKTKTGKEGKREQARHMRGTPHFFRVRAVLG